MYCRNYLEQKSKTKSYIRNKVLYVCHYIGNSLRNITNKSCWKTIKSFLINKDNLENPEIMLQDKGEIKSDEQILVKFFNEHYVNITYSWKFVW